MAKTEKDLQAQLAPAHETIKQGQAANNSAVVDKGMAEQSKVLADNGIVYPSGKKPDLSLGGTVDPKTGNRVSGSATTPSGGSGTTPKGSTASRTTANIASNLKSGYTAAQNQQKAQVDYAVNQGVKELERAEEDAQEQFQTQQNQVDIDEAKALDNQALYAEARGDRGGIGQAQYGQIQNTAMNNRRAINTARTKLATDTARQIDDLRAQGEFQKADAILQLTQTYLGQLTDLQKWNAEFTMQETQFNAQLEQWAQEFALEQSKITGTYNGEKTWEVQQAEQEAFAQAGITSATNGMDVTAAQLAAMTKLYGYDQAWVEAQKLAYQTAQENETVAAQRKAAEERCEAYVSVGIPPNPEDALAAGWGQTYINARIADYKRKNTKSGGGGGGDSKKLLTYQSLYDAGYLSPDEAYMYLTGPGGYNDAEAQNIVASYATWLENKAEQDGASDLVPAVSNGEFGAGYDSTMRAVGHYLNVKNPASKLSGIKEWLEKQNPSLTQEGWNNIIKFIEQQTGVPVEQW